jgi:signal transduction histidine kinase
MESKLRERGITFKVTGTDHPVSLDPELMEHVLINLVQNAIDALSNRNDPAIRMGSRLGNRGEVEIFVADNGEGIDDATGEKIFIPFFTTRKNGSGIGLALAKQILHLHHADITFISTPGEGTEFVIRL